ncbi:MAG: hypothetical protein ACYYKD_11785 [Rhodospirillales bacterium]
MYKINLDTDLRYAEEFRLTPIGRHSPSLMRILNILRYDPSGHQIILIAKVPFKEWVIGCMPPGREEPIAIEDETKIYTTREDAEWAVFCARWEKHTGQKIRTPRSQPLQGSALC